MDIPASFRTDIDERAAGPKGQVAHRTAVDHLDRLQRRLYPIGDRAWCLVGNGLSNQTFIEGPGGLIVVDTGDSMQEMQSAIDEIRTVTPTPVVACIYSHFHYVDGTRALLAEAGDDEIEIHGHARIAANRLRFGGEVAGRSTRGLVHQFGISLPDDGPDALLQIGLGQFFSNPAHRPHESGHLPVTQPIDEPTSVTIAGLEVEFTPAPSDSDDSMTIWFPELGLCVNNLVWPALFNVFAIRGEEYRDPRVLLRGLDHLLSLGATHLVGAHGPPLEGAEHVRDAVIDYRDSIQFMWDQTVRGSNLGLSTVELAEFVQLPERFGQSYLTQQLYGLVEHHVRQIHNGLFGWFDEDPANLFPLAPDDRAERMIEGFGGVDEVRRQADAALGTEDLRWAVELSSWLVRAGDPETTHGSAEDRHRLAAGLRAIGQRSTSANIRNWCLTRALSLEGTIDLDRFMGLRIRRGAVLSSPPDTFVHVIRVLVVPERSSELDMHLRWAFDDGSNAGLHVRRGVAVPTDGSEAEAEIRLSLETWADLLSGKTTLAAALDAGAVRSAEDVERIVSFFAVFDHPSLSTVEDTDA